MKNDIVTSLSDVFGSNKSDKSDGQLSESDLEAQMDKCNSFDSPERERIASIF
jgi:hypothetical protein